MSKVEMQERTAGVVTKVLVSPTAVIRKAGPYFSLDIASQPDTSYIYAGKSSYTARTQKWSPPAMSKALPTKGIHEAISGGLSVPLCVSARLVA